MSNAPLFDAEDSGSDPSWGVGRPRFPPWAQRASEASRPTQRVWLSGLLALGAIVAAFYIFRSATTSEVDLSVYRAGGRAVLDGVDLYQLRVPPVGLPFTYPPVSAVLFTPLSLVPESVSQVAWTAVSLVGLVALARLLLGPISRSSRRGAGVVGLAVVLALSDPVRVGLGLGQINIVLAVLVVADLKQSGRALPQGVLVGFAAAIKLTPLFLILYFLATARIRAAAWAAGTFAVLTAGATLILPQSSSNYWLGGGLADPRRIGGVAFVSNQSLNGLWIRLTAGVPSARMPWLLSGIVVAGMALFLCNRLYSRQPRLADGAALLGMLLISPVSWSHHWVFAFPLLVTIFNDGLWTKNVALRCLSIATGLILVSGVYWLAPNQHDLEYSWNLEQTLLGNSLTLSAFALILAMLLSRARLAGDPPDDTTPAASVVGVPPEAANDTPDGDTSTVLGEFSTTVVPDSASTPRAD